MVPLRRPFVLNFFAGRNDATSDTLVDLIDKLRGKEKYQIEQGKVKQSPYIESKQLIIGYGRVLMPCKACGVIEREDKVYAEVSASDGWPRCDTFAVRLEQLASATFALVPLRDDIASSTPRLVEEK